MLEVVQELCSYQLSTLFNVKLVFSSAVQCYTVDCQLLCASVFLFEKKWKEVLNESSALNAVP